MNWHNYTAENFLKELYGPASSEYLKWMESAEPIDYQKQFGEHVSTIPHYKFDGWVFSDITLRGFYEWKNLSLRKDDIVVTSFPKTGTTWIQEIVYHVMNVEDVSKPDLKLIDERFPFMEMPENLETLNTIKESPSPRLMKSHLPFSLLPLGECNKNYKIIYICRNPKDTIVSFYHFYKANTALAFKGDLQDFVNVFINNSVIYAPFWKHVLEFWDHRNDSNVLFLKYEDLHKDLKHGVRIVADFLDQKLTEEQISSIVHRCTFSEMAANPTSNHSQWEDSIINTKISKFMRKGEVGNWKSFFNASMNRQIDSWIETNLQHSDISFDYE